MTNFILTKTFNYEKLTNQKGHAISSDWKPRYVKMTVFSKLVCTLMQYLSKFQEAFSSFKNTKSHEQIANLYRNAKIPD